MCCDLCYYLAMNIENLTNFELSYGLAMQLNHKYDFGGYSVGRSERSFLLDLFFRLNWNDTAVVRKINPFDNAEMFLSEAKRRSLSRLVQGRMFFIDDREIFSGVILQLWIDHYREKISVIKSSGFDTSIDYSFQGEIEKAELIYGLYVGELGIYRKDLIEEGENHIDRSQDTLGRYSNAFRWHVDYLCGEESAK